MKYLGLVGLAILSTFLITNANAQTDTLPPLILKSPHDYEVTTDRLPHSYKITTSNFVVVDDSGKTANLYCGIDSEEKDYIHSSRSYNLLAGEYTMNCELRDSTGNASPVSWQVNVFADDLAPVWVKSVGGLYCSDIIKEGLYLKVIKYLNDAGVMVFDIQGSGHGKVPDNFKSNTCEWKKGSLSNSGYKIILETMASNGVFQNVSY